MEPGRFFGEVLALTLHPGGATRSILWRQSAEGTWQPAGAVPTQSKPDAALIEQRQSLLGEVSTSEQSQRVTTPAGLRILNPIRHAGQTVGILETSYDIESGSQLPPDILHFFSALCEITADFLSQHELQQLRRARTIWQKWDQYSHRLWQSLELSAVCAAIANDGRWLAECDRVSVLVRHGHSFPLKAVSGVDRIEPRSTATRSIESLASLVSRRGESIWRSASEPAVSDGTNARLDEALRNHIRDSGATGVGLVPVFAKRDEKDAAPPSAVIVFEQFRPIEDLAAWQSLGESLAGRSGLTLRAALERSHIPWLGLWQRLPRLFLRPATLFVLMLIAGIVSALILIPAEFTVTGPAKLWPAQRREVFASISGIIDQVLVAHGDDVQQNQPLLVLRDPELEADTPRIIGEIATVQERLKGVQAARLTGGNTPDAVSRSRQLTADEEELKERLRTLERQRLLIEERRAGLTLRSPIAGKVLTWDIARHLSARPVERGQSLLTIGETAGPWVVEVLVADKDAGPMLQARQAASPTLDVEFMLAAEPGQTYRGHVQDVSLTTETDETSHNHVRVMVAFDRLQMAQPRPGATALPRIHCGQRSLGYVWLHDLMDAIQTRLLF